MARRDRLAGARLDLPRQPGQGPDRPVSDGASQHLAGAGERRVALARRAARPRARPQRRDPARADRHAPAPHLLRPYAQPLRPELVSILIGVNDLVQGRPPEQYQDSLSRIYDAVLDLETPPRVVAISIPTWSYVPAAADFGGKDRVATLTGVFNAVAEREARIRNFTWVDIGEASTSGIGSAGWIASDDLHPGDAQYAAWTEAIWPAVSALMR